MRFVVQLRYRFQRNRHPRPDVTSKSESTSQYGPAEISARSTSMRTRMTEGKQLRPLIIPRFS